MFITNRQLASIVITAGKTDPLAGGKGISLVLVETKRPGFQRGRNLDKIGWKAQDTSELFFDDVRVPASNLLGQEGRGFLQLMEQLPQLIRQELLFIRMCIPLLLCRHVLTCPRFISETGIWVLLKQMALQKWE